MDINMCFHYILTDTVNAWPLDIHIIKHKGGSFAIIHTLCPWLWIGWTNPTLLSYHPRYRDIINSLSQ